MFDGLASSKLLGNTAFYDACYVGMDKLMQGKHGKHGKRVMLIISDGQDNASTYKLTDVTRIAKEANVLIYSVVLPVGIRTLLEEVGEKTLLEWAKLSGGLMLKPRHDVEIADAFALIATELRNQYKVNFSLAAEDKAAKRWSRLKVGIEMPSDDKRNLKGLFVRNREGFYRN